MLERNAFGLNHDPPLTFCWRMIFPEKWRPLFGIMRYCDRAGCEAEGGASCTGPADLGVCF